MFYFYYIFLNIGIRFSYVSILGTHKTYGSLSYTELIIVYNLKSLQSVTIVGTFAGNGEIV